MFIHSCHLLNVNMFVTVVLVAVAAVLCAPVAQDPVLEQFYEDRAGWHQYGNGGDFENFEDFGDLEEFGDFISSIKRVRSNNIVVNKIHTMHNTIQKRAAGNTYATNYVKMLQEMFKTDVKDAVPSEVHFDTASERETEERTFLNEIFRVIDEKLLEKGREVGKGNTVDSVDNVAGPILHRAFTKQKGKTDTIRQFRRETIPEIDVDFDRNIYKQFSHEQLNLQSLYEKKGGVCLRIDGYRRSPMYVISKCPMFYPYADVKHLCEYVSPVQKTYHHENIIELTASPVQDVHGFVYRNLYCAECHGAQGIKSWSTALVCEDMQQLKLSDGQQDVTFLSELVDKHQGCRRVLKPASMKGIHECSESDVVHIRHFGHETRTGETGNTDFSPFPLSFTLFMNFGFDGKTHILFSASPTDQLGQNRCEDNEMYDPVNDKCRAISCTKGYNLVDGSCQKTSTYEYDPTDEEFDLSQAEEPLQVVLILRNITNGMAYMLTLPGMDALVAESLATEVNISRNRIQNLTLSVSNNTETENGTLRNEIEIHRFTTTASSKTLHSPSDQKGVSHSWAVVNITDGSYETENTSSDALAEVNNSSTKTVGKESDLANTGHINNDLSAEDNGSPEKGKINTETVMPNSEQDHWLDENVGDFTVRIEFILKQPHRNTSIVEKSAKGVVDIMNSLIKNNSFMISLNGTDFQIQKLENAPNPESLDNFCKRGHKNFYDQDAFIFSSLASELFNTTYSIVYINETGKTYRSGQYDLTFSFDGIMSNLTSTKIDSFVIVCDTPKNNDNLCPRIILNQEEYRIFDNFSIYFANQTYNMSEYEYTGNMTDKSVIICAPDWSNSQRIYQEGAWALACGNDMLKMVVAESYLTFILGLISIISMLTVLITYSLFERLRNLPGVNTMNLTLSLFLGELVFILSGWIQPHVSWLCSGVGMLLHYLFLASFFWMNVMSYDVFRTFAKKCILRRVRTKKKYVPRYAIYAWGSPLIIVGICAFLDLSDVIDGVEIGYGRLPVSSDVETVVTRNTSVTANAQPDSYVFDSESTNEIVYNIGCWIQKPVASMVAFGGPMMLILLSNSIMFTRTIICIRASTKSTRNSFRRQSLNHMAGRDDVMLYIRMSTVMGFTWIFGLASSLVSAFAETPSRVICITLHMIGILFIVLNCSQGIFIFFAFVCNKRVFALYRGLVIRLKEGRKRPLSTSTSHGTIYSVNNTSSTTLSASL